MKLICGIIVVEDKDKVEKGGKVCFSDAKLFFSGSLVSSVRVFRR